jgi:hypothetical protein
MMRRLGEFILTDSRVDETVRVRVRVRVGVRFRVGVRLRLRVSDFSRE